MFRSSHWVSIAVSAAVLGIVAMLLFARGMDRDLNHDEHQFIAPGVLLSRSGLLPYRDYPLFHLPNLVFTYAALDRLTGRPLLSAKVFSVVCSFGMMALVFLQAAQGEQGSASKWRPVLGFATIALLLFDPLFLFTSGKTWNHEFPSCLMLCAICLQTAAARRNSALLFAFSGACASAAAGSRLTFLPILLPLLLMTWFASGNRGFQWRFCTAWLAGATLAASPTIWLFAKAPEAFMFDNFQFSRLRLLDLENTRVQKTATAWRKLRFLFKEVALPSWPLFLAFSVSGCAPAWKWWKTRRADRYPCAIVLLTVPFLIAGCLAPTRYQYQHLFALNCLLALGVAYGCFHVVQGRYSTQTALGLVGLGTIACVGAIPNRSAVDRRYRPAGVRAYGSIRNVFSPQEWFAVRLHARVRLIQDQLKSGQILTLAPTWPLEAGFAIYPALATGPFAWRSAHLISPKQRQRLGFLAPTDLPQALRKQPPAAILTGLEDDDLEAPLLEYAKASGFSPVSLGKKQLLWIKVAPSLAQPSELKP